MTLALCLLISGGAQLRAGEADRFLGLAGVVATSVITTGGAFYLIKDIKTGSAQENKVVKMVVAAFALMSGSAASRWIMGTTLGDDAKLLGSGVDAALGLIIAGAWNPANSDVNKLENPGMAAACTLGLKGIVTAVMAMNIKN